MFFDDLARAKRPAILVGGGAYKARAAIIKFAMQQNIPCFRTWNAIDVITDDLPIYCGTVGTYGGPGRNFGIQNCDLLLALGTRLSGRITGGLPETFARGAKRYIVNVDDDPTAGQVEGELIKQTCEEFMASLQDLPAPTDYAWLAQCMGWLGKYDPVKTEMMTGELHHYGFMRRLSELLPSNAIVVYDTGGNAIMMGHCFRSKQGQRIFSSNGNTPMGFSMCGAMGAWFAEPTRPVICIIGDGGMCMNIQELQTLKNYGASVKVFILNNKVLGNTASFQRVNGMKEVACSSPDYVPPDFDNVAHAYELHNYRISDFSFDLVVSNILRSDVPCVCNVIHENFCTYEPRISQWNVGIEDSYPFLPREEFKENMIIEPLTGWEDVR